MADYSRKLQRFICKGVNVTLPVDLMPAGKYPILKNVRVRQQGVIESRDGIQAVNGSALAQLLVHSVRRLTDPSPGASPAWTRVVGAGTKLYTGQGVLTEQDTGYSGNPLSMIPFRPERSPQAWMYIADALRMRKIRADGTDYAIGIAPPLAAPGADLGIPLFSVVSDCEAVGSWANAGMAGAITAVARVNTTITRILFDSGTTGWACIQPAAIDEGIQEGMLLIINTGGGTVETVEIEEIHNAISSTTIGSIAYDAGATGLCTIQPVNPTQGLTRNSMLLLGAGGTLEAVRVISVTTGPDGLYSFRCSTVNTQAAGAAIAGLPSFRAYCASTHAAAETLKTNYLTSSVAVGVGTLSLAGALDLSKIGSRPTRDDDIVHISISVDRPENVVEGRILFDCDNSTNDFTQNYFFSAFRANDLTPAATGTLTVTTTREITTQRDIIDEYPTDYNTDYWPDSRGGGFYQNPPPNQPQSPSFPSADQTISGASQWTEFRFRVKDLTRVGSDISRTLANIAAIRVQLNVVDTVALKIDAWWVGGGYGPEATPDVQAPTDVGGNGQPYKYRYRYRSSVTGAKSLPGPETRHGLEPRQQRVHLTAAVSSDDQVDKIDFERYGGAWNEWHWLGTVANTGSPALDDDYPDEAIQPNQAFETDAYQPFPVVDLPKSGTCDVAGTTVTWKTGDKFNTAWARATQIVIDGMPYETYAQPASDTMLDTVQNVGTRTGVSWYILEPILLAQPLPVMWGPLPDSNLMFGCGDDRNPGTVYATKGNDPDSAPENHKKEITSPSEPMMNGCIYDGKSLAASSERWFWLRLAADPSTGNVLEAQDLPVGRGLWCRYGIALGPKIWFIAKDGIYETTGGPAVSITDEDLYPLFPHEGRAGVAVNGLKPPNMADTANLRLSYGDGFLFFDYIDTDGNRQTLVYDTKTAGWFPDTYTPGAVCHYFEEGQGIHLLLQGGDDGRVYQVSGTSDAGTSIACQVRPASFDGGDRRATNLFGDLMVDLDTGGVEITVQPGFNEFKVVAEVSTISSLARDIVAIDLNQGLGQYAQNIAPDFTWGSTTRVKLYSWEPAWIDKPEDTKRRATDWMDLPYPCAYVRGFNLRGDTLGAIRQLKVLSDGGVDRGTISAYHEGEQVKTYWFSKPFVTHKARLLAQDTATWRMFPPDWICDPWPELSQSPTPWLNAGTPGAKYLRGLVLPIEAGNSVVPVVPSETLTALQPHRSMHLQGTNRTGAMGAMTDATESGFAVGGVFRDQADFTKLILYDADDFYGHWRTTKYLPNFDFTDCVLSFDAKYTNLFPLESLKYASIFQTAISVAYNDGTSTTIPLQSHILTGAGMTPASGVYTVSASPAVAADRCQIWYLNLVYDYIAAGGETAATLAANLAAQINASNWAALTPTMAIFADANGAAITIWAARYGTVNTAGDIVNFATGYNFLTLKEGSPIQINGVVYTIADGGVISPTNLKLTTSAGVQTGVAYVAPGHGVDGNSIALYTLHKTATLSISPAASHFSGGTTATSLSLSIDFKAILGSANAAKIRQLSMVFAPELIYDPDTSHFALEAYQSTNWSAVFSNWKTTGAPVLQIAGAGSVRVDSANAGAVYSGAGWSSVTGQYHHGSAKTDKTNNDKVTVTYSCNHAHDLYLGTQLFTDCGIVAVTVDGEAPDNFDAYLPVISPLITRRLIEPGLAAGTHVIEIRVTNSKNASSSDFNFTFDYLEAAVRSEPAQVTEISLNRSAATDYDTQHSYALPPERLVWMMRNLGLRGDWNHYIGAFYWPNRVRHGGNFHAATVTFAGAFSWGDGLGAGGADSILLTIGGTTIGKTVFPEDTITTIAAHFAYAINSIFVGVRAIAVAGVLTITVLSPINGFTISKSYTAATAAYDAGVTYPIGYWATFGGHLYQSLQNANLGNQPDISPAWWQDFGVAGTVTLAGSLVAATEGTWVVDSTARGLNQGANNWHRDFLAVLAAQGFSATISFSQELAGTLDAPPGIVWRQRYYNTQPVQTGTFVGTDGVGFIENVAGGGPYTITMAGHGYYDYDTVNVLTRGTWIITVTDVNTFVLETPVGSVVAPQVGDTVNRSWQSHQLAFSSLVGTFVGAGHLAIARLFDAAGLTPRLQMGEVGHWFYSSDRVAIAGVADDGGGLIKVTTSAAHGWSTGDTAIVPVFNAGVPVQYNEWTITVVDATNFTLNGSTWVGGLTAGAYCFGGSMGLYDSDQAAAALAKLGVPLAVFHTQDSDPGVNAYADANFLASRLVNYQAAVQEVTLAEFPSTIYELLWPHDVNRPVSPYFTVGYPYPQGGRLNNYINLPAAWKVPATSGFGYFKTEAFSWNYPYNSVPDRTAAINYHANPLSWPAAQSRHLIGWFNGTADWAGEYSAALPVGFDWIGFWALDQLCLLSWTLPLPDAVTPGVVLKIVSSDGATVTLPLVTTQPDQKTPVPFAFTVPFIGHEFQIQPQQPCRIWDAEAEWHFDSWPELTAEASAWFDLGAPGAKYIRGLTIPLDSNGGAVSLSLVSSDSGTTTLGPFTTSAGKKTEVGVALSTPLVGHEFQIIPSAACRVWWKEAKAHFDPYPELTPEYTPIMVLGGPGAKYFRGCRLTADTGNVSTSFVVKYDGGQTGPTLTGTFNGKNTIAFAFTPIIAHDIQLVPQGNARVFVEESGWAFDPWPELTTEYSAWLNLGTPKSKYMRGFTVPLDTNGVSVALKVISSDGSSITLPAVTTTAGKKTPTPYAFTVPLIGHEFQIQPQGAVRVWWEEAIWDFEPVPELVTEAGPWMDFGTRHNKYMRAISIPMDTGGVSVDIPFTSSEGTTVTLTATTVAGVKTPVPFPLTVPLIGREFQIGNPSAAVRIWFNEIQPTFEEWPELITETGPWLDVGMPGVKYIRGVVLPIDTGGPERVITFTTPIGTTQSFSASTAANKRTPTPFAFTVPMIGYSIQISVNGACRIWFGEAKWDADPWPDLTAEASAWMNCGAAGAKYFRAVTVPIDTNGAPITLTAYSSDNGSSVALGPFTTTAGRKTRVAAAFPPPFVGHEIQLIPNAACRVWWEEAKWEFDAYPELIPAYTPILEFTSADAAFVQGLKLTADTGGAAVSFQVLYDGGQVGPVIPATAFAGKQTVAFSFEPFIAHNWQLVPSAAARVWVGESGWVWEPCPELAKLWATQETTHDLPGFQHLGPLAYIAHMSTANLTFTVTADGVDYPYTIAHSSGTYKKSPVPLQPMKGRAWKYRVASSGALRLFKRDSEIRVKAWGDSGGFQVRIPFGEVSRESGARI